MLELRKKVINDYKELVGECLYYTDKSGFRDEEVNKILFKYNIEILENYEKFIEQFNNFKLVDLGNILSILNIEADNEWTNANRCEAGALIIGDYLRKINQKNAG